MKILRFFLLLSVSLLGAPHPAHCGEKIIVATGGGSRQLIENSLPNITMAVMNGIDFIELDVGATSDGQLIICKDFSLNRLTDIATVYPDRHREDGGYYTTDFTLAEIRQLRLQDVFESGPTSLSFGIPTLPEAFALIRRLEQLTEKKVRIALEISGVYRCRESNLDIGRLVLTTLQDFNYTSQESGLWLQSYDSTELQRLKNELMPASQIDLQLVQMIDENNGREVMVREADGWKPYNFEWMFTFSGLRLLATYAQALALPAEMVQDSLGNRPLSGYIEQVKSYDMQLYLHSLPTIKQDTGDTTARSQDSYFATEEVDGIYTDSFLSFKQQPNEPSSQSGGQDLPPFFSTLNLSRPQNMPPNQVATPASPLPQLP